MEETFTRLLSGGPSFAALVAAFIAGLLSVATPCVLPMIPITLGVMGASKTSSRGRSLLVSACYVAGIVVCFTVLGIFFGLTGKVFGSLAGIPAVNGAIALLLLLMAANAFGLFTLRVPGPLQRLASKGGAGPAGAFVMGLVAGIVAMPCIGPVLIGILTYVGVSRNAVFGGAMLASYALGFGLPFMLFGALSLKLPKNKRFTSVVEALFGLALCAGAFWFLRLALPAFQGHGGSYVAGAILAVAGLLLGAAFLPFDPGSRPGAGSALVDRVRKWLALIASFAGMALIVNQALHKPAFEWCVEKEEASCLPKTCKQHRATIVVFGAEWCGYCKEMERKTFADPRVRERLRKEGWGAVHVDVDENGELASEARIRGLPTVVFIDGDCNEMGRVIGYKGPDDFLKIMDRADQELREHRAH